MAGHLMVAFGLYSGLLWTALSVTRPLQPALNMDFVKGCAKLRKFALPVGVLVGLTAASGAFVAGNDAVRTCTYQKLWWSALIFCSHHGRIKLAFCLRKPVSKRFRGMNHEF